MTTLTENMLPKKSLKFLYGGGWSSEKSGVSLCFGCILVLCEGVVKCTTKRWNLKVSSAIIGPWNRASLQAKEKLIAVNCMWPFACRGTLYTYSILLAFLEVEATWTIFGKVTLMWYRSFLSWHFDPVMEQTSILRCFASLQIAVIHQPRWQTLATRRWGCQSYIPRWVKKETLREYFDVLSYLCISKHQNLQHRHIGNDIPNDIKRHQ